MKNAFTRLTAKTLKANRTRTMVTIIGILLATAMLTAVTTFISSLQHYMLENVFCPARASGNCSYPFCDRLHSSDRYQALFLDDTISAQIIEKMAETTKEDYVTWLMSHSLLTFEEAEAIFYFQMNGCLSINKVMLRNHCSDWKKIQQAIDQFIRAGLESFLIQDQRE